MKFACIGDIHGRLDRLRRIVEWLSDVPIAAALLVGDFAHGQYTIRFGGADGATVKRALALVSKLRVPTFFVPGNHDSPTPDGPGNIDGRLETVQGLRITGIGGSGPAHFGFPYEWTEDEIRGRAPPDCDVLLSHTPPARTALDRTRGGHHAGSEAIREIAERMSGILICGHIHEAAGVDVIERCVCYNTGSLGEPFGRSQVGVVECENGVTRIMISHHELDAGTSWSRTFNPAS